MGSHGTCLPSEKPSKPMVLIILDGFGCGDERADNAIARARTPVWDEIWRHCPHTTLDCSGHSVGLPDGQMGNSEVGHLHLGAGRLVSQDFTRINDAVDEGGFANNDVLVSAVDMAKGSGKALHVLGLLSPGGVHSHERHIHALVEMAVRRGLDRVYVHAFLDGRDTPPRSASGSIEALEQVMDRVGGGRIASVVGRFYAMDRDSRWERVENAYQLIVENRAPFRAATAGEALKMAYNRGESDEFVQATAVVPANGACARLEDGDVCVFMNYRADRARQLTRAITEKAFDGFRRDRVVSLAAFVTLTEYYQAALPIAFPPQALRNGLGEVLANLGLSQLRLAETEKYAHVTFFFNGGQETPFPGEERILVPSPKVKTYDLKPEMSAPDVTDRLVEAIESGRYDVIICNYANCDMVGHTGDLDAAVKAVEAVDEALGRVLTAIRRVGGKLLLTADHGNVEQMSDETTGQKHTAHTSNPVPLVYVGGEVRLLPGGNLGDVAPTLLALMGLEKPREMAGRSLVA